MAEGFISRSLSLAESCGAGSTGLMEKKSRWPWESIRMYPSPRPGNAMREHVSYWLYVTRRVEIPADPQGQLRSHRCPRPSSPAQKHRGLSRNPDHAPGHGFRGLASTILHEQGFVHDHTELQLARSPRNAASAAYNHAIYLQPHTKMMQDWADYLERTQRRGEVISLRTKLA